MKNNYTQQDISQFLNYFKALPDDFYKFEKVHQLVHNPNARARHSINISFKPLKFLIMTSITILSFTALLFWLGQGKPIQGSVQPANLQKDSIAEGFEESHIKRTIIQPVRCETEGSEVPARVASCSRVLEPVVSEKPGSQSSQMKGHPGETVYPTEIELSSDTKVNSRQEVLNITNSAVLFSSIISDNELDNGMKTKSASIIDGIPMIELSKSQLQRLGFCFSDNRITIISDAWLIYLSGRGEGCSLLRNSSLGAEIQEFPAVSESLEISSIPPIRLVFMSDEMGSQRIKWKSSSDDPEKFTQEYFSKKMQILIPVIIKQKDYPDLLDENKVFWFEPSQALFDSLPATIGKQIKQEYAYITADNSEKKANLTTTCTYFESCKSTLETSKIFLYPNPAGSTVNIAMKMPEEARGSILLVSIGGVFLKYLITTTSFSKGDNEFTVDVSDIDPGIYLVLLSTNKGFKTQRLVIQR